MLVISHVLPFPGSAGQQQRVANSMLALRQHFHLTFLTFATPAQQREWQSPLRPFCDEAFFLTSLTQRNLFSKLSYAGLGHAYAYATGLKRSNYQIGKAEFAPSRLGEWLQGKRFDVAIYEYWHAAESVATLQAHNILCVLDMHDILWQTYKQRLEGDKKHLTRSQEFSLNRYRKREEKMWQKFDALIAINRNELTYTQSKLKPGQKVFHAAMGIDLARWPYGWNPATPARLAYYGGFGNPHNQADAMICLRVIMPIIWRHHPETELWLIGSQPPPYFYELATQDKRIHVTGFVPEVAGTLQQMTAILCPWKGTFGFRSRLIEAMAVGTPVITTPDAVDGMELINEQGIWLGETPDQLAHYTLRFLEEPEFAVQQSMAARHQVENKFSFTATYGAMAADLFSWWGNTQRI